jgi:putative ABC transport system substrate-binding protein
MRRRNFLGVLGGAAVWPLAARAQQTGKLPVIGLLVSGGRSRVGPWFAALTQRLHKLGWIEGRSITFEYRWTEGRTERFAEIAAEFLRLKVNVIVTNGNASVDAAKQATGIIPIVFPVAGDPVGTWIVASPARPGNVTGLPIQTTDLAGERVEPLLEFLRKLHRIAILVEAGTPRRNGNCPMFSPLASRLGLETVTLDVRRAEES